MHQYDTVGGDAVRRNSLWGYPVFRILLGVFRGMLTAAAGVVLLAWLMLVLPIPAQVLYPLMDLIWGVCGFTAGQSAGYHARRRGILTGFCCGALLCTVLLCGAVLFGNNFLRIPLRCGIILLAAVCGGILGVNRKIRKPPY